MSSKRKQESEQHQVFREHCKNWLAENIPGEPPVKLPQTAMEVMEPEQLSYLQAWQKSAYEAGLVGCDYPKEYGGGGHEGFQRIANEEMQKVSTPFFPNVIGLGMAGPTILYHGSEELKKRLLPKLLSGEEIWCQGFSEPGAGSDLASVQLWAEKKEGIKEDKWVLNGHKVWTSLAHFASWMILLARTDKSDKCTDDKYRGMTYFVVPFEKDKNKNQENGLTIRPLIKASGGMGFNEELFEDFEIDDKYRLDEVGKGWQVAMTTLTHERGAGQLVMPASGGQSDVDYSNIAGVGDLIKLAQRTPHKGKMASDDPVIRDRLMEFLIRDTAMMQSMQLSRVKGLTDNPMRVPMQGKLVVTELQQEVAEFAMEIAGPASTLYVADENAPEAGRWPLTYINSFANTIAAGSSEVQKNILGERVLGMPKSK